MTAETPAPRRFTLPIRFHGSPVTMTPGESVIVMACIFTGQGWNDPADTTYQVIDTDHHPLAGLRYVLQNTAGRGQIIYPATAFVEVK